MSARFTKIKNDKHICKDEVKKDRSPLYHRIFAVIFPFLWFCLLRHFDEAHSCAARSAVLQALALIAGACFFSIFAFVRFIFRYIFYLFAFIC
jgi:hypothetical protein